MDKKFQIRRLVNPKPVDKSTIKQITDDSISTMMMNYHETMISQMVKTSNEYEMHYVCSEIQKFIEDNGIDVCFVMDEQELRDCLQEHQLLKLRIAELQKEKVDLLKDILNFCETHKDSNEYDYTVDYEIDDTEFISTRPYLKDYINNEIAKINAKLEAKLDELIPEHAEMKKGDKKW